MKQKERYRYPKYGERSEQGAAVDTGDPLQNLANAIVVQAADDYRRALQFLSMHPEPPSMYDYLTEREIVILDNAPRNYREMTPQQEKIQMLAVEIRKSKQFRNLKNAEYLWSTQFNMIRDCEQFFQGDWIMCLTKLDGKELMRMLKEEVYGSKAISADGSPIC